MFSLDLGLQYLLSLGEKLRRGEIEARHVFGDDEPDAGHAEGTESREDKRADALHILVDKLKEAQRLLDTEQLEVRRLEQRLGHPAADILHHAARILAERKDTALDESPLFRAPAAQVVEAANAIHEARRNAQRALLLRRLFLHRLACPPFRPGLNPPGLVGECEGVPAGFFFLTRHPIWSMVSAFDHGGLGRNRMQPQNAGRPVASWCPGETPGREAVPAIMPRRRPIASIAAIAGVLRLFLELAAPAPVAAQAGTWTLTGKVIGTASANGRTVQRMERSTGTLILAEDGTYRAPGGILGCPMGTVVFPAEVGTWRLVSRRQILASPSNLQDEIAALRECLGFPLVIRSDHLSARLSRDGQRLRVRERVSGSARVRGVTVAFSVLARLVGTLSGPPGAPAPGGRPPALARTIAAALTDR